MNPVKPKDLPFLFSNAFRHFLKNDPLRLGGSTAFFTIFALPPILLILISVFGIILNAELISGQIFLDLEKALGEKSARQIYAISNNVRELSQNWLATTFGFIFLVFIATTLFKVLKSNLNQLFEIKIKETKGVKWIFRKRLKSFTLIIAGGIFFLASFLLDSLIAYFKDYLQNVLPNWHIILIQFARHLISIAILTGWFSVLFKFLPDCKIQWKPVVTGSFLTAILFTIGEIILGKLLIDSGLENIYGASGFIVLVLLFVFYSSFIFFFGAALIRSYAEFSGYGIQPNGYATKYEITEIVRDSSVQSEERVAGKHS